MKKISALLGLVFVSIWIGTKSEEKLSPKWLVFLSVTVTVLLSFASLLPSAYGLAAMPALRTYIVPTYVLIAGFGFSGLMLGKWLSSSVNAIKPIYLNTGLLLCAVVFIVFSSWINAKYIYDDRGKYISFADQWDQVDAQIKQAKLNGDESITIPAMNGWASLDRPNQNPKFWVTACYSEYYGIQVYGPPYPKPINP
jgi:preprotein translocase subunit Sec61beta